MNDFFTSLYEFIFNGTSYGRSLYQEGVFVPLGYMFLGIPLIMMTVFYVFWKYPFSKFWHWLVWLILGGIFVSIFSVQFLRSNQQIAIFLNNVNDYPDFKGLFVQLIVLNGAYALISGFIYSLLLKQLPLPQSKLPYSKKRK